MTAKLIILFLIFVNLCISLRLNGQYKPEYLHKYNAGFYLFDTVILLVLFYYAGFFKGIFY